MKNIIKCFLSILSLTVYDLSLISNNANKPGYAGENILARYNIKQISIPGHIFFSS